MGDIIIVNSPDSTRVNSTGRGEGRNNIFNAAERHDLCEDFSNCKCVVEFVKAWRELVYSNKDPKMEASRHWDFSSLTKEDA